MSKGLAHVQAAAQQSLGWLLQRGSRAPLPVLARLLWHGNEKACLHFILYALRCSDMLFVSFLRGAGLCAHAHAIDLTPSIPKA